MLKYRWFCLFISIIGVACAQYKDESCTVERTGRAGICTYISACPSVIDDLTKRRKYTRCGFEGRTEIVCCPQVLTTVAPTPSAGRISEEKCIEYSSAVYEYVTPLTLSLGAEKTKVPVDKCGHKVVPLIVGGEFAKPREFPHMALIGFDGSNGQITWACGGSLISDQFIVTAAHCTETRDLGQAKYARLGDLNISTDTDEARPLNFNITETIISDEYRRASRYNDIALFKLDRKVPLSPYIIPACLPSSFNVVENQAIATGWGHTQWSGPSSDHLQKVTLDKFSHNECNSTYAYEISNKLSNGIVDATQICAGSKNSSGDTCQGDSGGPLQVFHPTQYCMYKLIGITSFGIACGFAGVPGIYTRVYPYLDWIESVVWAKK